MSEHIQEGRDYLSELTGGLETRRGISQTWSEDEYYAERNRQIAEGLPTWRAQNFESNGIVFIYFVDTQPFAQLWYGGWADARNVSSLNGSFDDFEFEDLGEAVERVEALAREPVPK